MGLANTHKELQIDTKVLHRTGRFEVNLGDEF